MIAQLRLEFLKLIRSRSLLLSFIALTGMRGPGMRLKAVHDALANPFSNLSLFGKFAGIFKDDKQSSGNKPQTQTPTPEPPAH